MKERELLVKKVESYYRANINNITQAKQAHFISRLYLWSGRTKYIDELHGIAERYDIQNLAGLLEKSFILGDQKRNSECKLRGKTKFRCKYKDLHNDISVYNRVFFKVMFASTLFEVDVRDKLKSLLSCDEVLSVKQRLIKDKTATFALSTPATNFLYLTQWIFDDERAIVDVEALLEVGVSQTLGTEQPDIHSRIYLLTHCIINESLFYHRPITKHKDVYDCMFVVLEQFVDEHYKAISLDQKCEFLVCAKLLGRISALEGRIFDECAQSVSPNGDFIVDVYNDYVQRKEPSLSTSEHRNVLFIMAFTQCDIL